MNDVVEGRMIRKQGVVDAPVHAVWERGRRRQARRLFLRRARTSSCGLAGPTSCCSTPRNRAAVRGQRACTCSVMCRMEMLSFEWNAPPQFPAVRACRTWVVVQLRAEGNGTHVTLSHLGWGSGDDWDKVFAYFDRAWDIVMKRLAGAVQ